ncbi:MAG: ABC transporter permease, partial [Tumebacillaceae bacterium]
MNKPTALAKTQTQATPKDQVVSRSAEMRAKRMKIRLRNLTLQLAVFIILMGGWQLLASKNVIDPFFFSSPLAIFKQIVAWFQTGTSQG